MRRHLILSAVLIGLSLTGVTRAQELRQPAINKNDTAEVSLASAEQPRFDDDGGRVFIVTRNAAALGSLLYHGGEVISQPQHYNIFLGSAWSGTALRTREADFSNLLSQTNKGTEQASLDSYGVRNTFLPAESHERRFDFSSDQTISDLQIQDALQQMFKSGDIQRMGPDTIYVVFLPPGVSSRLGSMIGGKHFAAYHNFFHAEQEEVHYVVVPFESDVNLSKQVAARAAIEAALNPTGKGWY